MCLRVERLDDRLTPTVLIAGDVIVTPPPPDQLSMGPPAADPTVRTVGGYQVDIPQYGPNPTQAFPQIRDVYTKPWMGC